MNIILKVVLFIFSSFNFCAYSMNFMHRISQLRQPQFVNRSSDISKMFFSTISNNRRILPYKNNLMPKPSSTEEQSKIAQIHSYYCLVPLITRQGIINLCETPVNIDRIPAVLSAHEERSHVAIDWKASKEFLLKQDRLKKHAEFLNKIISFCDEQTGEKKLESEKNILAVKENEKIPTNPISSWEHTLARISPGGLCGACTKSQSESSSQELDDIFPRMSLSELGEIAQEITSICGCESEQDTPDNNSSDTGEASA